MLSSTINRTGKIPLVGEIPLVDVNVAVIADHIPHAPEAGSPEALGLQFRLYLQESGVTPKQKKEIQYKICQAIKYYTSIHRSWNSIKISETEDKILFDWFINFCPDLIIKIDDKWILSNNELLFTQFYSCLLICWLILIHFYSAIPVPGKNAEKTVN